MENEKNCYYCGVVCNDYSCNPSDWSIPLCHSDEPGKVKYHHIGCVSKRLEKLRQIETILNNPDIN